MLSNPFCLPGPVFEGEQCCDVRVTHSRISITTYVKLSALWALFFHRGAGSTDAYLGDAKLKGRSIDNQLIAPRQQPAKPEVTDGVKDNRLYRTLILPEIQLQSLRLDATDRAFHHKTSNSVVVCNNL